MLQWRTSAKAVRNAVSFCMTRKRQFVSAAPAEPAEIVSVPCQSNGNITLEYVCLSDRTTPCLLLRIHYPLTSHASSAVSSNVAIYLPRGPLYANAEDDESNVSILRSSLTCPVVKVNYRCSREYRYPTPIHDVSSAVDFIISNLLPKRAFVRVGRSEHVGRLAICGELIGGQLATSVALTECRVGEPAVVAAAVSNPIVSWAEVDDVGTPVTQDQRNPTASRFTSDAVCNWRDALFRKPEHYFDSFASPAFFFRSAGVSVPEDARPPSLDDMAELALLEREDFFRQQFALSALSTGDSSLSRTHETKPDKKRKASRRYPSKALRLRLPSFHITAGTASVINNQAEELAHLLNQSIVRQIATAQFGMKSSFNDDMAVPESDRVKYQKYAGLGLWDTSDDGRRRMMRAAEWIRHTIERS